jgi:tetratricopeptide (TPR) repeat protein
MKILSMFPSGLSLTELLRIAPKINNVAATDLPMLDPDDSLLKLHSPIRSYLFQFHPLDDNSIHDVYSYVFKQAKMRVCQPGEAEFTENVQYLTTFGSSIESVLLHALDRSCESAIEASLDYSALLCSTKPHFQIMRNAARLARRLQSKRLLARCLQSLGDMGRAVGKMEGNSYQEAIDVFTALGDMASAAHCERNLGLWTNRCGYGGFDRLGRAAEMFRDLGDQRGEAQCLLAMAEVSKDASDIRRYLNKATIIFMELGDQFQLAQCKQQEAHILFSQRQVQNGLDLLWEAAEIFELLGDEHASAKCLRHLGVIFHAMGASDLCYDILNRALDKYQRLGRDLDAAFCMKYLAARYWSARRFAEAIALQEKAVPIFWGARFVFGGAETRLELGMSQIAAGHIGDAILTLDISRRENLTTEIALAAQLSASFLKLCKEAQSDAAHYELQRIAQDKLSRMTSWAHATVLIPYLDGDALTLVQRLN